MATFSPESIPDVAEVRESLGDRLQAHRVPILAGAGLLLAGSVALLAWSSIRKDREDTLHAELHAVVDDFKGGKTLFSFTGGEPIPNREVASEQARKLEEMRPRVEGTEIEAQVLLQLAQRYQVAGDDAKVLSTLDELRARHPDSPILRIQSFDSDRASLVDRIASVSRKRREFVSRSAPVVAKADPSVTALVETDLGKLKIGLYTDLAPKHVEAFLKQARSGGFNGTRLYFARRGDWIEVGGGERTRNKDPKDDREDDPSLALAPEDGARYGVKHRRRHVTSVPLLSGDQGDRFAVVLSENRTDFDSVRTPFGELLDDDSAATADRLGSELTYGDDAAWVGRNEANQFPNTPSHAPIVRRVSVWKDGKLADGHAWDTARVGTDQPEPSSAGGEEGGK